MLLRIPEVQAELKLSDEEKTKVNEMLDRMRGGQRGQFSQRGDVSQEERQKAEEESERAAKSAADARRLHAFAEILEHPSA